MAVAAGCCWLLLFVVLVAGVVKWLMYVGCCCWLLSVGFVVCAGWLLLLLFGCNIMVLVVGWCWLFC